MPPKPGSIPGYDPVSDDEQAKKKSRRKRKGGSNDEPTKASPSVNLASIPIQVHLDSHGQIFDCCIIILEPTQRRTRLLGLKTAVGVLFSLYCSSKLMLTTKEHRSGQCVVQRQQALDSLRKVLIKLLQ